LSADSGQRAGYIAKPQTVSFIIHNSTLNIQHFFILHPYLESMPKVILSEAKDLAGIEYFAGISHLSPPRFFAPLRMTPLF
jgi:hypothetical protein